eukprot:s144_g13.t1
MSKIRSCGSLATGNDALLKTKSEPVSRSERMKELELKREEGPRLFFGGPDCSLAMQKELDKLREEEHEETMGAVADDEEDEDSMKKALGRYKMVDARLRRNDKYSSKVYRYFVEYSDKESTKRSRIERMLKLSCQMTGSSRQPKKEAEVEKKFADGMLTKMSKITDLISKLDAFASGDDQARVKKSIEALEGKLNAAQTTYDKFVETRASALASAEAQAKLLACMQFRWHEWLHGQVACSDAIRQARVTRVKSKGLSSLAKVNLKRSESGSHAVFKKFGQSLDIKISKTDLVSKKDFPYVPFGAWLRHLVEMDQLDQLVGVKDVSQMKQILATFWNRFGAINPDHFICSRDDPEFDKEMCIPVLYHGDEGRGLKKKQLMVLSTHGVLGRGSHKSNDNNTNNPGGALCLNMVGCTLTTHFIQCVLPISLYNETPQDFHHMLDLQAREFHELFWKGIEICNRRWFVCCIAIKGDSPFLAKSGKFLRSFIRRPTRATSRTAAAGVCHLCLAGKEDYHFDVPFEDFGAHDPVWQLTCGALKPYAERSPLLQIPAETSGTTEELWKFDLFHNWHSGMGKYFTSSAVVVCLELVQDSIEGAFAQITLDFRAYCTRNHESPYHKKLTSTMFGVNQSFQDCPDAAWSKGDFTRLICKWFEDWCRRHAEAVKLINSCLSGLYRSGLFIPSDKAAQLADQGLTFLRLYAQLARIAGMVCVNVLWMALKLQIDGSILGSQMSIYSEPPLTPEGREWWVVVTQWGDAIFTGLFMLDVGIRIIVLRLQFWKIWLNYVDVAVTIVSFMEVLSFAIPVKVNAAIFRLLRIGKLARAIRMLPVTNALGSLQLLVKGLVASRGMLFWSFCLLTFLQCVAGMVISTLCRDYLLERIADANSQAVQDVFMHYGTFSRTFLTMFEILFANWGPPARILVDNVSEWYSIFFLLYRCVLGFAVINAIFVQQTLKTASSDEELSFKQKEKDIAMYASKVKKLFQTMDFSGDGAINLEEFAKLVKSPKLKFWMSQLELEYHDLLSLFEFLDNGAWTSKI